MSANRVLAAGVLAFACTTAIAVEDATPLLRAIRNNDLVFLKQHLDKSNQDARDDHGATLLMHAAIFGSPEAIRLLLDAGADVNAKNDFDATALLWAARDPVKVGMLLARGANVNTQSKQGRTPLIVAAAGSAESVRLLLARNAGVKAHDRMGTTALTEAALAGDVDTMRLLVERGADVNGEINVFQDFGSTPLMAAASSANTAAVQYLLSKGAKVNTISSPAASVKNGPLGMQRMTALMKAAPSNDMEMIKALLDAGADVNLRDFRGMNALMLVVASERADARAVNLLLKAGADPNARSAMGETTLDWAEKFGNPEIVSLLRQANARNGEPYVKPVLQRPKATPTPAQAIRRSIPLVQRSSTEFFKQSGCVGCHHEHMTAAAVRAAREAEIPVDDETARSQQKAIRLEWASLIEELRQGISKGGATDRLTSALLGLHGYDTQPDAITDTVVAEIASVQRPDGSWHFMAGSRPPINESEIGRTARAVRVLQVFGLPARRVEFDERIVRARAWLLASHPLTTDDYVMRLLGLYWSGADSSRVREAAAQLTGLQRDDGGWAGNRYLQSDAYSTAESLVALHETASLAAGSPGYQRGVRFLLNTQNEDGSWYVRSRAVKFQPYFQSGFPFDHDQWISAAATSESVVALAPVVKQASAVSRR